MLILIALYFECINGQASSIQICESVADDQSHATPCLMSFIDDRFQQMSWMISSSLWGNASGVLTEMTQIKTEMTSKVTEVINAVVSVQENVTNALTNVSSKVESFRQDIHSDSVNVSSAMHSHAREIANLSSQTSILTSQMSAVENQIDTGLTELISALDQSKASCDELRTSGVPVTCSCSVSESPCPPCPTGSSNSSGPLARDCTELRSLGYMESGVYKIYPLFIQEGLDVYCDMDTNNEGMIVFQRRQDGSVNFTQNWQAYKNGFGDLNAEFWLGNKYLAAITAGRHYKLRIDITNYQNTKYYAEYNQFTVDDEDNKFRLVVNGYSGNAGNYMSGNTGSLFSTIDSDNDDYRNRDCAKEYYLAGWWYNGGTSYCGDSHLNNPYPDDWSYGVAGKGFTWLGTSLYYPLKFSELKIS